MVRRPLVGGADLQQALIVPQAAEERNADGIAAADEAGGHRDLRQPGRRALLARARLAAVALEPAFVRVRPRQVRRIQQRVELLLRPSGRRTAARNASRPATNRCVASSSAAPAGVGRSASSNRRALTGASLPDASRSSIVSTLSPAFAPRERYAVHAAFSEPGALPRAARYFAS